MYDIELIPFICEPIVITLISAYIFSGREETMKRYKWGILTIILVILITCIGMIIRINVLFPNAKVITYTSDNPADLDGLIIKPVNYKVYTMEEYSEISSRYKNIQGEKADKSRVVVLNILLKNTTEDIITYYPSGNMVIENFMHEMVLHCRNQTR